MYYTHLRCAVCNKIIDTHHHFQEKKHAQSTAMLGGDARREHAKESPACTEDDKWYRGWEEDGPHDTVTESVDKMFSRIPVGLDGSRADLFSLRDRLRAAAEAGIKDRLAAHLLKCDTAKAD